MSQTIEQRLTRLERDNVELKREVATLAGQFEFISSQLRAVQVYMHNRFDQIAERFEKVELEIASLRSETRSEFASLRRDFPKMAAEAMREVLAERDRPN